jgi:hypothetical protein
MGRQMWCSSHSGHLMFFDPSMMKERSNNNVLAEELKNQNLILRRLSGERKESKEIEGEGIENVVHLIFHNP